MTRAYRVTPAELTVRAAQSTGIQFQVLSGTAGLNLATFGTVVELWLRDQAGGTSMTDNLTGALTVNGTAGGSVLWTPGTGALVAGSAPYRGYFRLRQGGTAYAYFPEDSELTINVRETF